MPSIDERVVSMAFENAVFEQRVAQTMTSLGKLNDAIAKTGTGPNGLENIEKSANKVTLNAPMSALDKLRAKLGRGVDSKPIEDIEKSGEKVTLAQPAKAVDNLQNKLDKGIDPRAIQNLERAGQNVTFETPTRALDGLVAKFSVLEGAAAVAFGNITSQAVQKSVGWAKGFGVGPIIDGLHEYQTNLKAVQTIQANTDQPLTKINKSLQELNRYSDQTIYNFGEMAKNIGTFTAAGVDLKTATSSIKGIANMAALSGSSSQQAATAMYQLSQAISSGRVGLQDWNSVVNAGMGGKKLQNALAQTAIAMGEIKGSSVKLEGPLKKLTINGESFRESIMAKPGSKPWLSGDVLVNTLATLDGRFSKAALSAELTKDGLKKYTAAQVEAHIATARTALEQKNGVKYTDAQFKALMHLSDSAFKSATEVKTLGQVFDVAKETIGSGWSASFQSIFGNLKEAKKTFTELSGAINGMINANALARNNVLHDWKVLGGRTDLIEGIKNVFHTLMKVLGTVKDAFREVFPAKTGKDLANMTENFLAFSKAITPSKETLENLKRTLAGFFAVIHIGWTIVKNLVGVIFDLLGVVGKGSGGFLNFTGGIGDFLVSVDDAISKGGALTGFFKGLTNILRVPIELIKQAANALFGLFGGMDGNKADQVAGGIKKIEGALTPMEKVAETVADAWGKLMGIFERVGAFLEPMFDRVVALLSTVGSRISDALSQIDFEKVLLGFQTGFLGGILLMMKKAFSGGAADSLTGGMFGQLKEVLGGVTKQLEVMQKNVQANMLLKIAAAIVALSVGILILSTIDAKDLGKAMTAIAVGLGELGGALKIMEGSGKLAVATMPIIAGSMLILAVAVIALAGAMKIMATMSWEDLAKGLAGMAGSLTAVGVAIRTINPAMLIPAAAGMLLMAVALNAIAVAAKIFGEMKWEELAKGLLGIGGALFAISAGLVLMGPELLLVGPGLIAAAVGVGLLAGAVGAFGAQNPKKMLAGILGLGLAMAALAFGLWALPPTMAAQGAGLVLVGIGITALAGGLAIIGKLGLAQLAKGLIGMGVALVELAVGMYLMIGTLPGTLALLGAAAAFAVLGPALAFMGVLPWSVILKGLGAMALSMGVIAVVGLVAAPALLAMGAALSVLGVGLLLIGSAVYLTAKGLALLGENGAKGIGVLVTAITAFVALLPSLIINFVKGLVGIIEEVAKVAPKVVVALGVILDTVIAFIAEHATKFGQAVGLLIDAILEVIVTRSPAIIAAGLNLLVNLLSGISSHITDVVTKAGEIITKFLGALATQAPRIIAAGAKLLASYLLGIANNLGPVLSAAAKVVGAFLSGVTKQLPGVITKGAALIITFLNEIRSHVPDFVKAGGRLIVSVINGVGGQLVNVVKAGAHLITRFIDGIADTLPDVVDAGFKAIVRFLHGIASAIRENDDALINAGADILDALVDGVVKAAGKLGGPMRKAIEGLFGLLPGWAKKILGIHSPSTVFEEIGKFSILGFTQGISDHKPALDGVNAFGNNVIGGFKDIFQIQSPSKVLTEIGKEVGHGFRDGLLGSADSVKNAFAQLREKISQELATQRENLKQEKTNLADLQKQYADKLAEIADLRSKKKPDKEAIKSAQEEANELKKAINTSIDATQKYKGVIAALKGARGTLTQDLQDDKKQLMGLSKDYEVVTAALDMANQALENAKRTRDDALKSYTDQFNNLPDWDSLLSAAMSEADMTYEQLAEKRQKDREEREKRARIDQVALYKKALQEQIEATKRYQETLAKLRALGLDDATYKKLLAQGLSGQDFASQLLAGGKAGIDTINNMDAELLKTSTGLATDAATALYQAGVDAAQGLVDGLTKKKDDLEKAMKSLATTIVSEIKRQLGIRSPSKVFAEIGKFATDGLAKGLTTTSKSVVDAAGGVGEDAAKAMTDSLANISDAVSSNIDVDPTITPVLDLSQVHKEAKNMPEFAGPNVVPITAAASYNAATAVSSETAAVASSRSSAGQPMTSAQVLFTQNNYSPKALSDIEIYRKTNNQLGNLKRSLGVEN